MRVLVATRATQGARSSDSDDCIDGELVWMIDACPMSWRDPDGECGCGRSFSGMSSLGSTTTAMVRELPGFSVADYESALRGCFEARVGAAAAPRIRWARWSATFWTSRPPCPRAL